MNLTISYRHLDSTESLNEKIRSKVKHLKKYLGDNALIKWTCSVEGDRHTSEVHVHHKHQHYHAEATDKILYNTFDKAIQKIDKQIRRKKSQIKDHIHRKQLRDLPV
ncbi:MAG: ribosomal subunit interface protein [Halobacteriovoraceae bacterium]|nr:ribosomal subunit interface protein [Halobacteriovoraceae bacterium]|tara:strand:- start:11047 stop:11367 length:321 start_codon:yes stop_codon:yes gene_type:complete